MKDRNGYINIIPDCSKQEGWLWAMVPGAFLQLPRVLQKILQNPSIPNTTFGLTSALSAEFDIGILTEDPDWNEWDSQAFLCVDWGSSDVSTGDLDCPSDGTRDNLDFEKFAKLDLPDYSKSHGHWSDPVWEASTEIRSYYFGTGVYPPEVDERRRQKLSRTGMATAWMLDWVESEPDWGTKPDGYSLHPTKEHAQACIDKLWKQDRTHGYYGPEFGAKPKEIRIDWDLFDKVEKSGSHYSIQNTKGLGILRPI